jgi:excisionase family DNA binding protein
MEFYNARELAAYLDVPLPTVRRWRVTGTGPRGIRVGRHVRYRKAEVERWLERNTSERSNNGDR